MSKRYPSYKPSGVEWIREIPEHWKSSRLRYYINILTDFTANGSFASLAENVVYKDRPDYSRLVRLTDLRENLENEAGVYVDDHSHKFLKKSELFGGEILIANVGAYAGYVCRMPYINKKATLGPNMFLIKFIPEVRNDFAFYLLTCDIVVSSLKQKAASTAQPKLNKDDVRELDVIIPPQSEQQAIARYLDEKIALIDRTIQKKQRLIELLEEKCTALINRAVTHGLNPDVKLKPSGVEWLGDVPEHWSINTLKRGLALLTDYEANGSFALAKENVNVVDGDRGYAWFVRATDLENDNIADRKTGKWVDENTYAFLNKSSLEAGDLLVVKRGEIGKLYLLPEIDVPATLAPNMYLLRLNELLRPKFTYYWLKSRCGEYQLAQRNASTTLGALYKDDCKDILVPFIPLKEQEAMEEYLDQVVCQTDMTIHKIQREISLLHEYRTSLINEVVTGKRCVIHDIEPDELRFPVPDGKAQTNITQPA